MRRGYELSTLYGKDYTKHQVTLYKQPWFRYWIGQVYHWYDMNIEKVPGIKVVEGWINGRRLKKGWESYIPTYANRDIKCYHLIRKSLVELQAFEVTEEQYNNLK